MTEGNAFEATDDIGELLARVERGEEVVITRLGKPVAKISPIAPPPRQYDRSEAEAAAKRIMESRVKLDGLTIRELIDEGRRF